MENKRPKISVPMTLFEAIIEVLSILVITSLIILVIVYWGKLPDKIPAHFNVSGEIDRYGRKGSILFLLPVILLAYGGLTVLSRFPQIYNYAVEITKDNAEMQYKLAKKFMSLFKLEIILLFSYMEYSTIKSALSGKSNLGIWFLPVIILAIFGTIGIYIYKSVNSDKKYSEGDYRKQI